MSQIGGRRYSVIRFSVRLAADILDGARLALICRRGQVRQLAEGSAGIFAGCFYEDSRNVA
jgi:hypothetical protein